MASKNDKKQEKAIPPTGLPLFYQKPTPLDKNKHKGVSLSEGLDFSFAAKVNAVPITLVELPHIMQTYPVAFSSSDPSTPMAILGLKEGENLFVDAKGNWLANTYIPSYIRRYPFIFAQDTTGQKLTLCVDDAKGIIVKNKKRPFFDDRGQPSDMSKAALEFCKSYQAAAEQTLKFSQTIEKEGILEERHAEIKTGDGKVLKLSGFRQINEEKLSGLNDKTILEWHKNYWMRFIYAHLLSTGNWQTLFRLMEERNKGKSKSKAKVKAPAKATKSAAKPKAKPAKKIKK